MLQITPQMRVLVATLPADFRRGIDGPVYRKPHCGLLPRQSRGHGSLVRHCRDRLWADPFSGTVFVFRNRASTVIKVLIYDGQGFWLCHKRLSSARPRPQPNREDMRAALSEERMTSIRNHGSCFQVQTS